MYGKLPKRAKGCTISIPSDSIGKQTQVRLRVYSYNIHLDMMEIS
jgi:hypothetical protein